MNFILEEEALAQCHHFEDLHYGCDDDYLSGLNGQQVYRESLFVHQDDGTGPFFCNFLHSLLNKHTCKDSFIKANIPKDSDFE